jgi:hypothetical protein
MNSKTYKRKTCSGHIYIIVNRDDNNKFCSILINPPSKTNDCGGSYPYALQDLATFALKRADGQREVNMVVKALSGHICNAMPVNEHHCKSCSDALGQIIKKEFPND